MKRNRHFYFKKYLPLHLFTYVLMILRLKISWNLKNSNSGYQIFGKYLDSKVRDGQSTLSTFFSFMCLWFHQVFFFTNCNQIANCETKSLPICLIVFKLQTQLKTLPTVHVIPYCTELYCCLPQCWIQNTDVPPTVHVLLIIQVCFLWYVLSFSLVSVL